MEKHSSGLITKTFGTLFKRFHLTIFFVFIVACLAGAVVMINKILTESSDTSNYTSSINAGTIDESTLNRIQSLHTSDQAVELPALPSGRVNPLTEQPSTPAQ